MFQLIDISRIEVLPSQYNNEQYFHISKGAKRSVNLSLKSWQKLKDLMVNILQALDNEESYRQNLYQTWYGSQTVVVEKFEGKMYGGIHFFN